VTIAAASVSIECDGGELAVLLPGLTAATVDGRLELVRGGGGWSAAA